MKIVLARVIAPDRALFSGPHQRRQEEKLGVVRVSFKAQVTCISWHMCALRGNEKRSAWECKSKDAPQTERNAIDAQNEGAAGQRTKNNTRKSSGRGAHRADLLSAYRAWRKVVRATRPERVVLAFAPPGILVLPPSAETTTARFSSESPGLHGLCFRSSSSAAACRLCRLCTGTGREAKNTSFFCHQDLCVGTEL